ncbi:MAG: 7,8-didemethyl-8-hydroxy-5-deazariboflavin synthase subunit CofG [Methanotrichaceae archaeon]|nr:7,8-didemethyl-8-hydroxy-5-deazariboflavin synthase subunit CofG [Methanotrichaceae archaeon]
MQLATLSNNIFIPVTDLCRNRCSYCSFRRDFDRAKIITRREALKLLVSAREAGCTEALFSLGENPWDVDGFSTLIAPIGHSDLIDYLVELCELALEQGLLPHTNAGILSDNKLAELAPYNASMGLMLETTAEVDAHKKSPGKKSNLRLAYIAKAGELKIPFTTGILVGIGESLKDRIDSLKSISRLHEIHDHIQEVIIQPLDPKPGTPMAGLSSPHISELIELVSRARTILQPSVALQVPPNLVDPLPLLRAGANDLGGLSPLTPDWINPERPWPSIVDLKHYLREFDLQERLPVYPRYVKRGWYGRKTANLIDSLGGPDGLRRK